MILITQDSAELLAAQVLLWLAGMESVRTKGTHRV